MCDRSFGSEHAFTSHMEAKHGRDGVHRATRAWEASRWQQGELTCSEAGGAYSYSVTQDMYDGHRRQWVCSICSKGYKKKKVLQQHLDSGVHEDKR